MSIEELPFPAATGEQLTIDQTRDGAEHALRVSGELDLATLAALEHELRRAETQNAGRIVLDLSGLDFIEVLGVHLVPDAVARSRANGHRLTLVQTLGMVLVVGGVLALELGGGTA